MIPQLNHDPSTCQACWDKGVTALPASWTPDILADWIDPLLVAEAFLLEALRVVAEELAHPGVHGEEQVRVVVAGHALDDRGDPLAPETDEEPWTPTDPPGFSMTGGDVFVLASVVAVSWAAVILGVLLVRRIWRDGGAA